MTPLHRISTRHVLFTGKQTLHQPAPIRVCDIFVVCRHLLRTTQSRQGLYKQRYHNELWNPCGVIGCVHPVTTGRAAGASRPVALKWNHARGVLYLGYCTKPTFMLQAHRRRESLAAPRRSNRKKAPDTCWNLFSLALLSLLSFFAAT
jgi:hypothetical protein